MNRNYDAFVNTTSFLIPISTGDQQTLHAALSQDPRWEFRPKAVPDYLFPYACKVVTDPEFCRSYSLRSPQDLKPEFFCQRARLQSCPTLSQVELTCFATGIAFLEFIVCYKDQTVDQIIEFAHCFRNANWSAEEGASNLCAIARELLPQGPVLFFTNSGHNSFRSRCLCFHMLYLPQEEVPRELPRWMYLLKRGYNHSFYYAPQQTSPYDMEFGPYPYMHYAGSQEGLVCLCTKPRDTWALSYIQKRHYRQLMTDYRCMYLLLLNQRFSSILYMDRIVGHRSDEDVEAVSGDIITLKTNFSFRVVSDDLVYQNVYARMYEILGIDGFITDLDDIQGRCEALKTKKTSQSTEKTEKFLMGLSLLTIFSALIDAAGYFDRLPMSPTVSTCLSLAATMGIIGGCLAIIFRRKK